MKKDLKALNKQRKKSSAKARRSAARLAAVQAVYQMGANQQESQGVIEEFVARRLGMAVDGQEMIVPDGTLFTRIVSGVEARYDDLQTLVDDAVAYKTDKKADKGADDNVGDNAGDNKDSPAQAQQKVEFLLQAILLCGSWELMAEHDTDAPVIISDYIEITKAFFERGEAGLVNAVLDRVKHFVRDGA